MKKRVMQAANIVIECLSNCRDEKFVEEVLNRITDAILFEYEEIEEVDNG